MTVATEDHSGLRQDVRSVTRLALRMYKSIEKCDIELAPLTIFVGRNGSGKSNLLDALRFVSEALLHDLDFAIRERGGIDHVRRKSLGGRATHPGVSVELRLSERETAKYEFKIAAVQGRSFRVDQERCEVFGFDGRPKHHFRSENGVVEWSLPVAAPTYANDRLFLTAASGYPEFRPVYDILRRMAFHNLSPEVMKYPQRPGTGDLLAHDGRNLASVIKQLESSNPEGLARIARYMSAIGVPISRIVHKQAGPLETIEVSQKLEVPEGVRNSNFDAIALSDGTIRALGILVSLVSARNHGAGGPTLIGIEEPETALHPAAAGALMEALLEGTERTQVLVTCHSPDLLDYEMVTPEMIRPVIIENGRTQVGTLAPLKADLIRKHLSTAGELLRMDQLEPDQEELRRQREKRGTLWEHAE